ncbi:MAG TPA: hypothetical protein DHU59_12915, partial [Clostridiales bacterium]|nr:hypothetical protein [Clostridiales bacterium]
MSKILIISMEYPPATGGAGVIAQDIAVKLVRNKFNVTVVTNYLGRDETVDFELIEVKTIPKYRFISLWNKIRKLPLESYQKIILNDIGASMVAAFFFDEELQKKSIVIFHGSEPEKIFIKPSLLFKSIGFKNRYLSLLERCSVILSVSNYMKKK